IFFTNEVASGRIHYDDEDEELVKQIIETIKFNTGKVKTTTQKTAEMTELNKKYTFGELSFKIPDNCEVTDNGDNITIGFSDHSIIQIASTETTKEICSSADSDKELLLDAILNSFVSGGSFETTSEYSKTDVKGFFAITQEATYLSLYDCTLYCFFSENNAYILTFAKSQLLEAEEAYDLQHEIINSFEFESVDTKEPITTEETTKPVTEAPAETSPSVNVGINAALETAKSYIDMSGFSYERLISQLEYEGFTHEEAVSAAESCGADWNAEALESAKSYVEMSGFSYTKLISQLEFEKFTHEQAVYGADNCGADWNQQAADSAQGYMDIMSMSREELLSQLLFEGFTQEQAEYGVQSVGY
ncbi:MAG: Ltp family lipoprotein, partial [Ruminococcus sp.]|nr:Ltp family lipoprotein [Ruminococcus sp.]